MLTYDGANALLNCLCGRATNYSYPTVYVGLSTTTPNRYGGNITEPSGNGYARVLLGTAQQAQTQKMSAAANGANANTEIIYFPEATGAWGTCTHFCLFNAAEEGTCIAYGALTDEIAPVDQTVPIIRVGDLTMSIS